MVVFSIELFSYGLPVWGLTVNVNDVSGLIPSFFHKRLKLEIVCGEQLVVVGVSCKPNISRPMFIENSSLIEEPLNVGFLI